MADAKRSEVHLGVDSNVLISYLDAEHPDHNRVKWLAERAVALNPTVVHESYHALVFKLKWRPKEARAALLDVMADPGNLFIEQTRRVVEAGLDLAVRHNLGGRDALILASFLLSPVRELLTMDEELLRLGLVRRGRKSLLIRSP